MEIVVRGRNVEVPDHFRQHVTAKIARIEKFDHGIIRVDVELQHERNPRQSEICQRVEITCRVRGPVVRAEACAADFYKALDTALDRLERRFRHIADRRRIHHGRHTPTSVAAATGPLAAMTSPPLNAQPLSAQPLSARQTRSGVAVADRAEIDELDGLASTDVGGGETAQLIVREKQHTAKPMSMDQALYEMELVGHDFYLFADVDSDCPSVVYRRKGYAYGVIRLTD